MGVCVCVRACVCASACVCVCMCIIWLMHVCTCTVHVYAHTHTHTHTNINISLSLSLSLSLSVIRSVMKSQCWTRERRLLSHSHRSPPPLLPPSPPTPTLLPRVGCLPTGGGLAGVRISPDSRPSAVNQRC